MNINPHSDADRAPLARLLPVPADRGLPEDRHRILREYLMREIRQTTTTKVRSPRVRELAVAGAMALTAAAAAAVGSTLLGVGATPAYAILADGDSVTVTLKVGEQLDTTAFERDMARAGMPTRVVDMQICGFTSDEVVQALKAYDNKEAGAASGDKQVLAIRFTADERDKVIFNVTRGQVPAGRTLVLYLSHDANRGFPFAGEVIDLRADWQPCTALPTR